MIDRSKLAMRGRYGIATGGAVTDHVLMAIATEFENTVMRKIAALSPAELATRFGGQGPGAGGAQVRWRGRIRLLRARCRTLRIFGTRWARPHRFSGAG